MSVDDWDRREMCPDGGCIGVIGPDGQCKVCGRAAPNWGDERKRGLADADAEETDAEEDEDEDENEYGEDDEGGEDEDEDEDEDDGDDWSKRTLCSDGSCTGVIADGKCSVCGKAP